MQTIRWRKPNRRWSFAVSLGVNAVASLFVPFFTWSLTKGYTLRNAGIDLLAALIYSNCIGSLFWLILPLIWQMWTLPVALRWVWRLIVIVVICVVGTLVGGLIFPAVSGIHIDYWASFAQTVKISIVLGGVFSFAVASYESLRHRLEATQLELRTRELDRERALKQATEAQLASLESRIHPHFLFNTINSVSSLIHDDPDKAERLLERMAALLRFSLDANQSGLVPLEHEMKIVSDYLEIERTRFGDRLRFEVKWVPAISQFGVPPLSIQTLVENSVKYAVAPKREGGQIFVEASVEQGKLVVDVWDDGPAFSLNALPASHGLDNLQNRLDTLFRTGGFLEVDASGGGKIVRMTIPASPMKRTA